MVVENSPVPVARIPATGAVVSATIIFWVCVLEFPVASVKVQVTVEVPCVERVNESVVVPVINAPQLSVTIGAVAMVAEHSPVTAARIPATGAVVSATIIFWVCVLEFPVASVKVQVTVEVPCVERVNESVVVPVINAPQLSVTIGAVAMVAEHSPVTAARIPATGAVVSATIIFWVCVLEFPVASVKVQVTVEVPCVERVNESVVVPVINAPQLSVTIGAVAMVAEHSPVTAARIPATGAVVSATIIFWVCVLEFPAASVKVQVTVEVPCVERVNESVVVPVINAPQLSVTIGAVAMVAEHSPVAAARIPATGAVVSATI